MYRTRNVKWRRRMKKGVCNNKAGLLMALVMLCTGSIKAQQTIFNVPSTDVLDKGKIYLELDASLKPNDSTAVNKFSSFVPRAVVGTGSNIESGFNVIGNIQP